MNHGRQIYIVTGHSGLGPNYWEWFVSAHFDEGISRTKMDRCQAWVEKNREFFGDEDGPVPSLVDWQTCPDTHLRDLSQLDHLHYSWHMVDIEFDGPDGPTDIQQIALNCLSGFSDLPLIDSLMLLREMTIEAERKKTEKLTISDQRVMLEGRKIAIAIASAFFKESADLEIDEALKELQNKCPHDHVAHSDGWEMLDASDECSDCRAQVYRVGDSWSLTRGSS